MVTPNLLKMDLPRLLNDIPKYKPWVSAVNWQHWEEFCSKTDQLTMQSVNTWDLHHLVSTAAKSSNAGAVVHISSDLQKLLDKETAVPQKVHPQPFDIT